MYRLQVTKFVDNHNYDEEMKEYEQVSRWNSVVQHPIKQLEERNLDVMITDEEYQAVKKSILKQFN